MKGRARKKGGKYWGALSTWCNMAIKNSKENGHWIFFTIVNCIFSMFVWHCHSVWQYANWVRTMLNYIIGGLCSALLLPTKCDATAVIRRALLPHLLNNARKSTYVIHVLHVFELWLIVVIMACYSGHAKAASFRHANLVRNSICVIYNTYLSQKWECPGWKNYAIKISMVDVELK